MTGYGVEWESLDAQAKMVASKKAYRQRGSSSLRTGMGICAGTGCGTDEEQ